MGDDRMLGLSMLAAAAFAVVLAGCSTTPAKPNWTTAHPDTAATASEASTHPAAMVDRAEAALPPASFLPRAELADLRFRPGQIDVTKADHPVLDSVVRWLKEHPAAVLMIEGHTDDLGTRESNLAIAAQRAVSIGRY